MSAYLQLCGPREHLLKPNADSLDDREEDGTANGTVPRRLVPATNRQRAACEETSNLRRVRKFRGLQSISGVLAIALYLWRTQSACVMQGLDGAATWHHNNSHQQLSINLGGHIRIFLLPDPLDGAVECAEHATPDTKVAAQYWRAHLDGCDGSQPPLAVRAVPEALHAVPDRAADGLVMDVLATSSKWRGSRFD